MDLVAKYEGGSGIFIQVGAGAGDLDKRADNRDGFTEFIKKLPRERVKKLVLVEPNPGNLPLLRECWKDYPEAEILEVAIIPSTIKQDTIEFFLCPDDKPHYQVASVNISHVKKHYGENCEIQSFTVLTKTISDLLKNIENDIELLALDIEGIDAEVLLDLELSKLPIQFLSFEHIHLGDKKTAVWKHLKKHGFIFRGNGCDVHRIDSLFEKLKNTDESVESPLPE